MRLSPPVARRLVPVLTGPLLLTALAALAPASAQAAGSPFTCEASLLSGTILTAPTLSPLVANQGKPCATTSAGLPQLTAPLGIVGLGLGTAATSLTGDATRTDKQQAIAGTSIADVKVGSLSSLGLALPLDQIPLPAALSAQTIDISAITGPLNAGVAPVGGIIGALPIKVPVGLTLPSSITVDISAAVRALVALPSTDVLGVKAATTIAGASCVNGTPTTGGQRSLTGLTVLGNAINVDTLNDQPIIDTQHISLSQLDPNLVKIPALDGLTGGLLTQVTTQVAALVKSTLAALPPIDLPIDLLRVSISPGSQAKTATSLTQFGPAVAITALGMPVVNLQLGSSKVGTAGVDCTAAATTTIAAESPDAAAQAALSCTARKLVLTDVLSTDGRVRIVGVADKKFVGKTVDITFAADGKRAARATVAKDGKFTTTAKLPSAALRASNKARYTASIGKEKSLDLKLARRMYVDKVRSSGGRVRITGHLTGPLGSPAQTITLTRRVTCKKNEVVTRFKPKSDGTFSVLVKAPAGETASVYRLGTKVRKTTSNAKLFPTFTLPTGVNLVQ